MAGIKEVSNYIQSEKSCSDKVRTAVRGDGEEPAVDMKSEGRRRRRAQTDSRPVVRAV